jgi:hypothetical protein
MPSLSKLGGLMRPGLLPERERQGSPEPRMLARPRNSRLPVTLFSSAISSSGGQPGTLRPYHWRQAPLRLSSAVEICDQHRATRMECGGARRRPCAPVPRAVQVASGYNFLT